MNTRGVNHLLALLEQHGIADEAQRKQLADEVSNAPWLTFLQTLAAWIAALFIAIAVTGLSVLVTQENHASAIGVVLIGVALWIFSMHRSNLFARQVALGLSLAGQLLLLYEQFLGGPPQLMQGAVIAALLAAWPYTSNLHRVVCMVLALWFTYYRTLVLSNAGLLVVLCLAVVLWLTRRHWSLWPRAAYMAALAHATTFLALALLLWRNSQMLRLVHFMSPDVLQNSSHLAYARGAVLLWLACAAWLTRSLVFVQRLWLLGAALVLAMIGFKATPALLLCLTLALVTFHACQRAWCALSMLCMCVLLGLFYYSLHQTLLFKSLSLGATGLALMLFGWQVRRWKLSEERTA